MPMPLLADLQKRENIVAGGEAELEERQQTLRRQEDEVKDRESTVLERVPVAPLDVAERREDDGELGA